jgi:hypothetical protein
VAYEITLPRVFRQTADTNCWFHAARTIVYQRSGRLLDESRYLGQPLPVFRTRVGRGAGVPSWLADGLPEDEIPRFESTFGFAQPASRPATWTAAELEQSLRDYGPLWFAGANQNFGHVVVVSGINGSSVRYGDPAIGSMATAPLEVFNAWKRQTVGLHNPLYYPVASPSAAGRGGR